MGCGDAWDMLEDERAERRKKAIESGEAVEVPFYLRRLFNGNDLVPPCEFESVRKELLAFLGRGK